MQTESNFLLGRRFIVIQKNVGLNRKLRLKPNNLSFYAKVTFNLYLKLTNSRQKNKNFPESSIRTLMVANMICLEVTKKYSRASKVRNKVMNLNKKFESRLNSLITLMNVVGKGLNNIMPKTNNGGQDKGI